MTTTGVFALPSPVTFTSGAATSPQVLTRAGTNNLGWWLFGGDGAVFVNDSGSTMNFEAGPAFLGRYFGGLGGYVTAPGSWTSVIEGATLCEAGQAYFSGTLTLTVADEGVPTVPEPASLLLLATGLAGIAARRSRRASR